MRDGARLAGMQPVKVGSRVSQPRKIHFINWS
jgi:hypothetical protein